MTTRHFKLVAGLMVLLLTLLACGTPEVTQTVAPTLPVLNTPVVGGNSGGGDEVTSLTRDQRSYLAHATVRIWGVKQTAGGYQKMYHGSGTLLTSDGMILSNCHVVDPVAMGYPEQYRPDALIIELVQTEDKPPVAMYIGEVLAIDPTLDLGVIRAARTMDGASVNPSSLNLPYVQIGNSDEVRFGDPIFIFGYPGIGGETITYSTGNISGFDTEAPVGDRAWIKTDATIAGGNSGGLAANVYGQIIGVPSQIGVGSSESTVDCRRIEDTNGDGQIDQNDSCIPTGGFINGIRPVNWALPLIQAAQQGRAYVSPYGSVAGGGSSGGGSGSGAETMRLVGWSSQLDSNYCPVNPSNNQPSGITELNAVFSYSGFTSGQGVSTRWTVNGDDLGLDSYDWDGGQSGNCYSFYLTNGGDALPDGQYSLDVYNASGASLVRAQASIGGSGGSGGNTSGSVTLMGTITDANNGKGIANILVVVLNPGVDTDAWLDNPTDPDVYSFTQTNAQGQFQIADPLYRGQTYGIVVGNPETGYQTTSGYLQIKNDSPATLTLNVELNK
jgi:S1-C subfamily serine protease